jgi:glycosyltransferase involved in cell wall biosynthesis
MKSIKNKVIRVANVAVFFNNFYKGQFKYFNLFFEVIGVASFDVKHFNEFKDSEEVQMVALNIRRTISPLNDFISLIKLWRLFLFERPLIIHSHLPKAGLLSMIAGYFAFVKIRVHSVEGMPLMGAYGLKRRVLFMTERLTYSFATRIICNSKGLRDFIISENLCKPEKIVVFSEGSSTGVDYEFYNPENPEIRTLDREKLREELKISTETVVFFFVGRIGIDKGFNELIDVFEKIVETQSVKLLLAGVFEEKVGRLPDEIIQKIKSHKDIIFAGRVPDLRPYFMASDVFIFPSYREGFPNAVLEAGAMGLPCIVTDINGCNEIITDKFNGLIIKPKDRESLNTAMLEIIGNENLRKQMASNIRPSIVKRYTRIDLWNAMLNEYKILIIKSK